MYMRKNIHILSISIFVFAFFSLSQSMASSSVQADGQPLRLSYEPGRVFIGPASDEGESIVFNVSIENLSDRVLSIEKLVIAFKKKGNTILEKEQHDPFFNQGLIAHERKVRARSRIKWTGICLTSESFGQVDEVELIFHLKGRRKFHATQSLPIPVSRYLQKTILKLPFKGMWKVSQGHQCKSNHRISGYGGDFAWDFAAMGPRGNIAEEAYYQSEENKYVYGFGREIFAPAPGKIVVTKNDVIDNEGEARYPRRSLSDEAKDPLWVFGNYVIIDHLNGEFSLLGHMMKGSLSVKEGDEVKTGDLLGRCGNSGNTPMPHLHYQLMDGLFSKEYQVNGLPALFSEYILVKPHGDFSDEFELKSLFMKKELVTNGDPQQDAILLGE